MPQKLSSSTMTTSTSTKVDKQHEESLNYHIFSYKKYISSKQYRSGKWAAAKLILTENLITKNRLRAEQFKKYFNFALEADCMIEHALEEALINKQLRSLENYGNELRKLLEKRKKSKASKSSKKSIKSKRSKPRKSENEADTEMLDF